MITNPTILLRSQAKDKSIFFLNFTLFILDRVIYMKTFLPKGTPKYCSPSWAKKIIPTIICVCVLINLPYFFIFKEVDGRLKTSAFFESM